MNVIAALFPNGIDELFNWKGIAFENTAFELNKTALLALFSTLICVFLFVWGMRRKSLVPTGMQNVAEMGYEFVETQIALPTIGDHHGAAKRWAPFLGVTFFFIFFINIWSTFPGIYFPATSRIAIPMFLALVTWLVFVGAGFKAQGPLYMWKTCKPSGVPAALLLLVIPIEFVSKFLVRPFSLTVRLFANMVAGHVLLSVFAIMTAELLKHNSGAIQLVFAPLPFAALVAMTGFELLVALLQAYIFAMLTGVYIGDSLSVDH
ncbi:MAG: F0F1 ATP synthase subunit A [Acidimicrobiia bacterium]